MARCVETIRSISADLGLEEVLQAPGEAKQIHLFPSGKPDCNLCLFINSSEDGDLLGPEFIRTYLGNQGKG